LSYYQKQVELKAVRRITIRRKAFSICITKKPVASKENINKEVIKIYINA